MHPESRLGKWVLSNKGYVPGTFPVLDSSSWFLFFLVNNSSSSWKIGRSLDSRCGSPQDRQINTLTRWIFGFQQMGFLSPGLSSGSTQVAKAPRGTWRWNHGKTWDFEQQTHGGSDQEPR